MADKIVAEYTVKVDKALKDLNKLASRVDKVDKERQKTQAGFKSMSDGMVSNFKKVGVALGLAFGAQQVIQLGKEMVTLAAKAEGVERAFKRIGSAALLDDLRKATRGTVSDLVLMQRAVQASNFKLPLDQLASLLKFASARARETGESVDFLVNSIVLGIGRKSPLILDNLGISAVELRTRLKGVGVEATSVAKIAEIVGQIATEELEKMGTQADTTADKIAQISAAFENLKTEGGDALITLGTGLATTLGIIDDIDPKLLGINAAMRTLAGWRMEDLNDGTKTLSDLYLEIESQLKKVNDLKAEENELGTSTVDRKRRTEIIELLQVEEARLDTLRGVFERYKSTLKEVSEVEQQEIRNLQLLNAEIKKLTDERLAGDVSIERTKQINLELVALNEERAKLLANVRSRANDQQMQEIESLAISEVETQQTATDGILADYEYRNGEILEAQRLLNDELQRLEDEKAERQLQDALRYAQEVTNIARGLSSIQQNLTQQELINLQTQLEQEQITREEYDTKRKELLSKQAEDNKQFAIFDAVINGAVAVVKAFSDGGPILAALVAAGVALEIAAISSAPTPQFAEGGWVDSKGLIHGRSHASGGVKIEAEGNEYITKGKYAKPNAAILEAINTGNWEKYKMENIITPAINQVLDGGFESMGASYMLQNSFNDKNMLFATDRLRKSNKMDAQYIVSQLKPKTRKRGNYA